MALSTIDAVALAVAARTRPAVHARWLHEAAADRPLDDLDAAWCAARLDPEVRAAAVLEARALVARAASDGHAVTGYGDVTYPPALRTLPDPPVALWTRGEPAVLARPMVAIVGSRAARPGALEVARGLGRGLAAAGVVVVSGLARGVDGAAHAGALEGGQTAAVLGTGIDLVYPPRHGGLAADIVNGGGALVTEFLPGSPPLAHHFPLRNRILSGLARGVVVVEASEKSGSLITARLAAEQGRDVMVVPGDVRGGANAGGHALLRDGARLVESAADVLEELGWAANPAPETAAGAGPAVPPVVALLRRQGGLLLDDLVAGTGRSAADLLGELLDLELAGLVARDVAGRFLPAGGKW